MKKRSQPGLEIILGFNQENRVVLKSILSKKEIPNWESLGIFISDEKRKIKMNISEVFNTKFNQVFVLLYCKEIFIALGKYF